MRVYGGNAVATEAEKRAVEKYNKANTVCVLLRLNISTDKDIITKLDSVESKMGYIKRLIREDIKDSTKTI